MKTNNKKLRLSRVLICVSFMLASLAANAQSWDWDDCVEWLKYEGIENLATYAHPTNDMKSFSISQTSPDVIVKINFEGTFIDFSSTYKIVRNYYRGGAYFYDVKVLSEGDHLVPSFAAWNSLPKLHPKIYRSDDLFPELYNGVEEFEDLSLHQQAAAALTMDFLAKQL